MHWDLLLLLDQAKWASHCGCTHRCISFVLATMVHRPRSVSFRSIVDHLDGDDLLVEKETAGVSFMPVEAPSDRSSGNISGLLLELQLTAW